jgi:predicted Zn-dependent protease
MTRQYDQAIQRAREALDMDPNFMQARHVLGLAYLNGGRHAESIAEFQKEVHDAKGDPVPNALLARAYAAAGNRAEAYKLLGELEQLSKERYVSPADVAFVYADLSEKDQAFRWLEKAYAERCNSLIYLKLDPELDSLRSDPRFTALLNRMKLSPQRAQ